MEHNQGVLMSTQITILTTFHRDGMRKYGQRFIDSFAKNVDKKIKLLVYAENCQPINPDPQQIEIIDVDTALPKLTVFKERWKDDPKANGTPPTEIQRKEKIIGKNLNGMRLDLVTKFMLYLTHVNVLTKIG
jgi:hypothetical protein